MNIQEQEISKERKRLDYAISNGCIDTGENGYDNIKIGTGSAKGLQKGKEVITATGKREVKVNGKKKKCSYEFYSNLKVKNLDSEAEKNWSCNGIGNAGNNPSPPPPPTPNDDDNDDNGGDDNSPTTNWKSNFCMRCTDSEGSVLSTKTGGKCKDVIEDGGICTKFNKSKIVGELPTLKNKTGDTQPKINKNMLIDTNGEIFLQGESKITNGKDKVFKLKKEDGEWFFYDDEKDDDGAGWIKLVDYFTTSLHEQTLKEQKEMKSISDKIEEKLRDIYFYTVSEKGKERVMFDLQDKRDIEQHLKDLHSQNIVGDRGFVMAVVRAKGSDKEDGQLIKLGSYPKDSNVNLGFGEEKGLGGLVGTQYFSIKNNDGPDDRDFEIVKGDINKDIEFKKEVEVEEPKLVVNQPVKEEPYEEVMKQKELKGLASLVSSDEVGNNFTKKQKEILEKLKGQGYLFKRPVEDSNYKKTKVKSSEFTESFHVWKKQD